MGAAGGSGACRAGRCGRYLAGKGGESDLRRWFPHRGSALPGRRARGGMAQRADHGGGGRGVGDRAEGEVEGVKISNYKVLKDAEDGRSQWPGFAAWQGGGRGVGFGYGSGAEESFIV